MQKPLVSIVIPTYGGRTRLKSSIESALYQTYENIEVLVVDDNPPYSENRRFTENLMSQFSDSRVIYLKHPFNKNGAAARNTGIRKSTGEYIAFLDDDDCFLPQKIEKQLNYLISHPNYDGVYCFAKKNDRDIPTYPYVGHPSLELLVGKTNMFTPTLMFRRYCIESINGFDEKYRRHQDYEFLLRCFKSGFEIGCVPEVLTELGTNRGENSPHGEKLEELKSVFLSQFDSVINSLEKITPGTKKNIYATHYARVFVDHIKMKNWKLGFKTIKRYFFYSPSIFFHQIAFTAKHILFEKK